eukprot:TRINITY_DN104081_c0_g1_i1.p2 TRINITY_DN104081_c0_g1~~TRINITY_DN104081_c0_g1_i1.p2  ORF type:complete len:149 (-),score=14.57 TRINITY_DN104081_c0_g1_i1:108-509(-)
MHAMVNSLAAIDVLTDIVMGVELLLQNISGKLMLIAVFLLVACLVDIVFVLLKILNPDIVASWMHAVAIVIEIAILAISITVVTAISGQDNWDLNLLVFLSLSTTVVNFLHHLFIMYDRYVAKKDGSNSRILS